MRARGGSTPRVATGVVLALAMLWVGSVTASRDTGGVRFAPVREIAGMTIHLVNATLYRYLLFDVYAAALYLERGAEPQAALADDVTRRLEVVYLREVAATDLARAANAVLEDSLDAASLAKLAPKIQRLHGWYRDVGEGDRVALNWVPGLGTTLEINDQAVGNIEGADFARAYFGIWLGENPIDDGLRAALLAARLSGTTMTQ